MHIILGMVVLNRKDEVIANLRRTCPYVDRAIVVDGDSTDGTKEWLQSDEARSLGIECIVHKQVRLQYGDHTPLERNIYLSRMDTSPGNWCLVIDSDEFLEQRALENLRHLATEAEKEDINTICFQAHDVWTYVDGRVYDNVAQNYFHHSMFFKAHPGMRYRGHTHAGLVRPGMNYRNVNTSLQYIHRKTETAIIRNGTYTYWTSAKPAANDTSDPIWLEFHYMMNRYGYYDWHHFKDEMKKGGLPAEIKQWFIDHRNDVNGDAASYFIWYFIFNHPEENIDKLGSDRHNYSYNYIAVCKEQNPNGWYKILNE